MRKCQSPKKRCSLLPDSRNRAWKIHILPYHNASANGEYPLPPLITKGPTWSDNFHLTQIASLARTAGIWSRSAVI